MVSGLHGPPFAVPQRSLRKRGEGGEVAGRQADTQATAGDILLRVLATLRDRSVREDNRDQERRTRGNSLCYSGVLLPT